MKKVCFEGITLVQGDCLSVLPLIYEKSVDMVLCDLPYGSTRNRWDSQIPLASLWAQYERAVKDDGAIVLFAQTPFDKILGASNLKMLKYEWIWDKPHGTGHLNSKKAPLKKHENVLVFYKRQCVYNPQMSLGKPYLAIMRAKNGSSSYDVQKDVVTVNDGRRYPTSILKAKSDRGLHPTQKPLELCEYFIKTYTDAGALVLDNCMGSGTTGAACARLGRRFIGIERDENYFEIARQRILYDKKRLNNERRN